MFSSDGSFRNACANLLRHVRGGLTKSNVILPIVEEILRSSPSFSARYKNINAVKLLSENCRNNAPNEISAVIKALHTLEKYGKNLLRAELPAQWRVVRLSNTVFHQDVDKIKGGRETLMQMGYCEKVYDGLSFSSYATSPNRDKVALVTSNIILLKFELAMYQKHQHPSPRDISSTITSSSSKTPKQSTQSVTSKPSTSSRGESSSMDDLCVVCGLKVAEFHCVVCKTKQCSSCDSKWHLYPNRVNHQRKRIRPASPAPHQSFNEPSHQASTNLPSTYISREVFLGTETSQSTNNYNIAPPARYSSESTALPLRGSGDAPSLKVYSSAKPVNTSPPGFTTQERNKWEDRFALIKQRLLESSDKSLSRDILSQFVGEVDKGIRDFRDTALRLEPCALKRHLHERSDTLAQEKATLLNMFPCLTSTPVQQPLDDTVLPMANETQMEPTSFVYPADNILVPTQVVNTTDLASEREPYTYPVTVEPFPVVQVESLQGVGQLQSSNEPFQPQAMQPQFIPNGNVGQASKSESTVKPNPQKNIPLSFHKVSRITEAPMKMDEMRYHIFQEDFRIKCMETVDQLRVAESKGLSPSHMRFALQELAQESNQVDSALDWLSDFNQKIKPILECNPGLTPQEASSVVCECNGNIELIERTVVEKVTLKRESIAQPHLYDEETSQTCLYKTKCCIKTLIELQRPLMKGFLERLDQPVKEQLFVKDFLRITDPEHMRDALVSLLQIDIPLVSEMMCSILLYSPTPSTNSAEMSEALGDYEIKDILEAAKSFPTNKEGASKYLFNKCKLCLDYFSKNKVECMTTCGDNGCTYCQECLAKYLEIQIREGNIRDLVCPVCKLPDIDDDEETAINHFSYLDAIIKARLDDQIHEIFQQKIRDKTLMNMPNFRWCSHCENGFLYERNENSLKMICSACRKATCYSCKKPWEVQHEGISCQAFLEWKQMNDADFQAEGLAAHLKENGIDCPACNFRYALAKGGCMHFKCITCSFQFCSGCKSPFKPGQVCTVHKDCFKKGFHAHHPRDCLFYLRDLETERLQKILADAEIPYGTESKHNHTFCHVQEQKETSTGPDDKKLHDDVCGREVHKDNADLCILHYKEYLVNLINNHRLDPATVFTVGELATCLARSSKNVPQRSPDRSDEDYRSDLLAAIKRLPLIHERAQLAEKHNEERTTTSGT